MPFKIEVVADECIGCGACVAACEAGFDMDGDKAIAKNPEVEAITCEQDAADGCPVTCIKITEI